MAESHQGVISISREGNFISLVGRRARVFLAVLVILLVLSIAVYSQDIISFSIDLSSGSPVGNGIDITYENCSWEQEPGGIYHLLLDKPGMSKMTGIFTIDKMPPRLFIQINHRTGSLLPITQNFTYDIEVNGRRCTQMEMYMDLYTILGYDITNYIQNGKNEFTINLKNTAKTSLWIRRIDISPVVSFVESYKEKKKSDSFWLLIPLYLAYFFLLAITISYLLFVIMWRNNFGPQAATMLALIICGLGFGVLPFLIFGLFSFPVMFSIISLSPLITAAISILGLIIGLIWIMVMHK